ncbi:MAG TPA: metallopeptidase TldD-related protein [Anaerolineales bacterium]|nr:metallopeptidase TldD-related protein [Anaerolineales bacterium]
MKEQIINTLKALRTYAIEKGYDISLVYHEEDSYLMRFANSAISLNTNEHLIRLEISAHDGRKRASYELITDLDKVDEMKKAIDAAAELVVHAQPLNYQPTLPTYKESFVDESGFDENLAKISNEKRLAFFNEASKGLETEEIRLSGIFSNGATTQAFINTHSEHVLYFKTSDAQISMVLAHTRLKWEVQSEQSAWRKSDLDPGEMHGELSFLLDRYLNDSPQQLPLGNYEIVFGSAAIADMINFMNYIGFNGGLMKRGYSFLKEEQVGKKVFSEKFTLNDDTNAMETFPFKRDFMGKVRDLYPLFTSGVFQGYIYSQDDADEFSVESTSHTVRHFSLVIGKGGKDVDSLQDLVKMPRQNDLLYIPFLHYMNIVNPSKGVITASSRFGALLLKKDGSVVVPFNVRLTQSLLDIFGDKVDWLSKETVPYNTSQSYGSRNPTAIVVPKFMAVKDLEISHSNSSY